MYLANHSTIFFPLTYTFLFQNSFLTRTSKLPATSYHFTAAAILLAIPEHFVIPCLEISMSK